MAADDPLERDEEEITPFADRYPDCSPVTQEVFDRVCEEWGVLPPDGEG